MWHADSGKTEQGQNQNVDGHNKDALDFGNKSTFLKAMLSDKKYRPRSQVSEFVEELLKCKSKYVLAGLSRSRGSPIEKRHLGVNIESTVARHRRLALIWCKRRSLLMSRSPPAKRTGSQQIKAYNSLIS